MVDITELKFISEFIFMCAEGYRKGWHERNGGNLSYRLTDEEVILCKDVFNYDNDFTDIGTEVPLLASKYFLVTGSNKHMRNVPRAPNENICIIQINDKGDKYKIIWGLVNGGRPTSELPTHLMNHEIKLKTKKGQHRLIYHAHPTNTIALTFVLPPDAKSITHELWEMATEDPIIFPQGIGIVPWMVPGGKAIAIETAKLMYEYDVVIWMHHGVFCSGSDFDDTFGLMDTVEKASEICTKVISMGGKKQSIPEKGFVELANDFHITLNKKFLNL